jgi:hypothetical protein
VAVVCNQDRIFDKILLAAGNQAGFVTHDITLAKHLRGTLRHVHTQAVDGLHRSLERSGGRLACQGRSQVFLMGLPVSMEGLLDLVGSCAGLHRIHTGQISAV